MKDSNDIRDLIILKSINLSELTVLISMNKASNNLAKEILDLRDKLDEIEPDYVNKLYTDLLNRKMTIP